MPKRRTERKRLLAVLASLGWVSDAFEGQIYKITRVDVRPALLRVAPDDPLVKLCNERFLGTFLIGGTFGGLLIGSLAKKWGRHPDMVLTLLF